ncbi:hypothetical protein PA0005 [Candidatus Phytoplasma australiense]|uniref:Uncharacterized protein n=1 Tax=Phytoplasma australiense TaxID=59748 RepID=B1V9D9_PHYAS|nr:hypothetical protein PA0005 [Candidatus Phytoplasma australiense]
MNENKLTDLILKDDNFKKNFARLLNIDDFIIQKEEKFIDNIKADFCFYNHKNKIIAILECKGQVGITEYIRGVGQILQYQGFKENNIFDKFLNETKVILVVPSSVFGKKSHFNPAKVFYPKETELLVINNQNHTLNLFNPNKIYKNKKQTSAFKKIDICPYYFRDTRIWELYFWLKEIHNLNIISYKKIHRKKDIEDNIIKQNKKIFYKNILLENNPRNALITLSSLGLVDYNNVLTDIGQNIATLDLENFCLKLIKDYFQDIVEVLLFALDELGKKQNKKYLEKISYNQIVEVIKKEFDNQDILFLTDSQNRYISSWMNVLKKDLGCINFLSK